MSDVALTGREVDTFRDRADAFIRDLDQETVDRAVKSVQDEVGERKPFLATLVSGTTGWDDFVGCDLVLEAVYEELGVKQEVFARVRAVAPNALLATNTSSLSVEEMGADVGIHFFNPVAVMPLVEIVRHPGTSDEALATAHDVVRALNDREDSPLYDEIKLLGVGRGRVAQAPLAQELKKLFAEEGVFSGRSRSGDVHEEAKKFFVNYFKQIALVFGGAWNGRKYSIRSASALRAFIRVAPDVVRRLDQEHADRSDFRAIGRVIAPWGRRIGDLRFETEGAWKGTGSTVEALVKELRLALQYPEGAAV